MFDPEALKAWALRAGVFATVCFLAAIALLVFVAWAIGGP